MARIRKEDHAKIVHLVDVERRAVREVAAEFGCTPAAIYTLLTKLRRGAGGAAPPPDETQPPLALGEEREVLPPPKVTPAVEPTVEPVATPAGPPPTRAATPATPAPPGGEVSRVVTFERAAIAPPPVPPREEARRPASAPVGGKLAKPGMGLLMRTPDGEETMTPFRSLDDLLSAIKPILRAGARSPEPVWFSLQPIDLATIDVDAA